MPTPTAERVEPALELPTRCTDPTPDPEERFDFTLTLIAPRGPSFEARRRRLLRSTRSFRAGDLDLDGHGSER